MSTEKLLDYQEEILSDVMESLRIHHQAAVNLFTTGGKTYIGIKVIEEYLDTSNKPVLWMGPNAAVVNVRRVLSKSKVAMQNSQKIEFITFEALSREKKPISNNFGLFIIDEAHRALAKKTYDTIDTIFVNNSQALRFAMTATPNRGDGINAFRQLTPKATIKDYGISWGTKRNIINKIHYHLCTTNISSFDVAILDDYREVAKYDSDVSKLLSIIDDKISQYKFDLCKGIKESLLNSGMDTSCKNGDRHIVFFSSIKQLRMNKGLVEKAFSDVYEGCKVRSWEYHNGVSKRDTDKTIDIAVHGDAIPKVVDIIFTVDKGIESIHPKNIVSVCMFRKTYSHRVFTQEIGRVMSLKAFGDREAHIFDFAENCLTLLDGTTIGYGRNRTDTRWKTNRGIKTVGNMHDIINKRFDGNVKIEYTFSNKELAEIYKYANDLIQIWAIKQKSKQLLKAIEFVNNHKTPESNSISGTVKTHTIYDLRDELIRLSESGYTFNTEDIQDGVISESMLKWFKQFCTQYMNDRYKYINGIDGLVKKFGHMMFYRYTSKNNSGTLKGCEKDELDMCLIDSIVTALEKVDWDESKLPKTVANRLLSLRARKINQDIAVQVCRYAEIHDVDIVTYKTNKDNIKDIVYCLGNHKEYRRYEAINSELHELMVDKQRIPADEFISRAEFLVGKARAVIDTTIHGNRILVSRLEEDYPEIFEACKITEGINKEAAMVKHLCMTSGVIDSVYEEFLFSRKFSELPKYILGVFDGYGVKSQNKYSRIINQTKFMQKYNEAIGDTPMSAMYILNYYDNKQKQELIESSSMMFDNPSIRNKHDDRKGIAKKLIRYIQKPGNYCSTKHIGVVISMLYRFQSLSEIKLSEMLHNNVISDIELMSRVVPIYAADAMTKYLRGIDCERLLNEQETGGILKWMLTSDNTGCCERLSRVCYIDGVSDIVRYKLIKLLEAVA